MYFMNHGVHEYFANQSIVKLANHFGRYDVLLLRHILRIMVPILDGNANMLRISS